MYVNSVSFNYVGLNNASPSIEKSCIELTSRRLGSIYLVVLMLTSALFVSVSSIMVPTIVHATAAAITTVSPVSDSPTVPGEVDVRKIITVTGSGFLLADAGGCTITAIPTGSTVGTLYIDLISCSISGVSPFSFTGYFRVGVGSSAGSYDITVTSTVTAASSAAKTAAFAVTPAVALSPKSGAAGTPVTVKGAGFSKISVTSCTVLATAPVQFNTCSQTVDGILVAQFIVKSGLPSGSYLITGQDGTGGTGCSGSLCSASALFTIVGGPILVLSPPTGYTGTIVTVTGSGYSGSDTYVDLQEGGTNPAGGTTDLWGLPTKIRCTVSGGSIVGAPACQFTVKSNALGKKPPDLYSVYGIGQTGDYSMAQFIVLSNFQLTPKSGGRSTTLVTLSGSGFVTSWTSCTPTTVPATPVLYPSVTCSVDTFGILTGSFYVDANAAFLTYTVRLSDVDHIVQGSVSDTFTVTTATLLLTPGTGFTGQTVTVSGYGWSLSDTSVRLFSPTMPDGSSALWGAPYPLTCLVSGGSITSCTFTVRSDALGGGYTVTGQGIPYSDSTTAVFSVLSKLVVTPKSAGGAVTVTLSGSGYIKAWPDCHSQLNVAALKPWEPALSTPTCSVDASGHLTGSFAVFDWPTAAQIISYTITLTDTGSSPNWVYVFPGSAFDTFTVLAPTITLNPNHGGTGSAVTVTGTNFSLKDTSCEILWEGNPVAGSSCSVTSGVVSGQFTVPVSVSHVPAGYTVTVNGRPATPPATPPSPPPPDSAIAIFTVGPTIALNPASGRAGASVLISGSSFATGDAGPCTITSSPSNIISSPTCTISASGGVSASFTVVAGALAGSYTISVTGTLLDHGEASFTVPSAPTLTLDTPSGPASTLVGVSGSNYAGTGACILTSAPGGLFTSYACALSGGMLTGAFAVASGTLPGTFYTITVTTNGGAGDTASAIFGVTTGIVETLTLNPTSGPAPTVVSGSATGFLSDASCQLISGPPGLFSSSNPPCTIMGGGNINVGFTVSSSATPGAYTVIAIGNTGKSASGTFTVTAVTTTTTTATVGEFTISINPDSLTLDPGAVSTIAVTVQSTGSFNSPVTLSIPTFPSGVTGGFSPNPVTPPAGGITGSVLSLAVSPSAPGSTTIVNLSGTGGGISTTAGLTLIVTSVTTTSTISTTSTGLWVAPKCVIATATFGSEAAPAVQFLRNFRDHLVLGTKAGSAFMDVFNAWYYSFSPSVASYIAANDPLRAPMRVLLYPLLGILGLSSLTYPLFGSSPEFAVVIAGLVASSLIGLVYLTPFTFLGMRALTKRRRIRTTDLAKGSLISLAVALALLTAGELMGSFLLLAAGSSVVVLTCVIAVPVIAGLAIVRPATQ